MGPMSPLRSPLGTAAVAALVAFCASCRSAPDRTIPDPLPETLEWALPAQAGTAFLGLEVRENNSGSLDDLSFDPGVRVHRVVDGSPASAAGVRIDDVVLSFEGVELAVPEDLDALIGRASGGDRVALQVQRGDTVFDLEVTLRGAGGDEAPAVNEAFVLDPARTAGAWGTSDGAVLVSRAKRGPVRGLPVGARVIALDGDPIVSGRGLVKRVVALAPGTRVTFTVAFPDGGDPRDVDVSLLDAGRRTTRFSIPVLATYDATADRERENFVLLDLYVISLFRYQRDGTEKSWSILRFFQFAGDVGELER